MSNQRITNIKSYLVNLNDYQIIKEINRGGFGSVSLIERKSDQRQFAAKVNFGNTSADQNKFLSREISILMRVQSPTIIRFCGFSLEDFQGKPNITILMEYHENGSLRQLIEKEQKGQCPHAYDNTAKQIILCGIAHGMMILHSRRIIHRDLKLDNVLLDEHFYPYITDFGLSKFLDSNNSQQSMAGGTVSYMSPEIIKGTHYNSKTDVYSFGILMFEVLTGEFAFSEMSKKKNFSSFQLVAEVSEGKRPEFTVPIKPSFKKLIERCWSQDPKERPTFRELFHKLSLSTEEDDETIESSIRDIISKEDEEEDDNDDCQYLLDDVDTDRFFDYVDAISNESTTREEGLQKLLEEQTKRIKELEELHQQEIAKLKEENKRIEQSNIDDRQEIELLKAQLSKLSDEKEQQIKLFEIQSSNPLEGIPFSKLKETIEKKNLTKITIPSSMTSIKNRAFSCFTSIVEVTIPSYVTSIGDDAFTHCKSLRKVTIPSSVTSIGRGVFSDCSSLTEIIIQSSVTSIFSTAFHNCSSLLTIVIPSSVTSIGDEAFSNCSSLTQITIPSSVTSIGYRAFSDCSSLTQITIPSSVTSIGNEAFYECSSLTTIEIPSSVRSIGRDAFENCSSLKEIVIPSSVTSIKYDVFSGCSSLTRITIPSSVTSIDRCAFENCISLTTIEIPSSVTSIEYSVFKGCTSLTEITIPSSLTSIPSSTFQNCEALTRITIPSSVTSIGSSAFENCISLTTIEIPSSVTSISFDGFKGCSKLNPAIQTKLKKKYGADIF